MLYKASEVMETKLQDLENQINKTKRDFVNKVKENFKGSLPDLPIIHSVVDCVKESWIEEPIWNNSTISYKISEDYEYSFDLDKDIYVISKWVRGGYVLVQGRSKTHGFGYYVFSSELYRKDLE